MSFSENRSWGDVGVLKDSISFCRNEFGDFDSSYALNASAVVYELLEYLLDKDISHIYNISTYVTDTIDFKLGEADPSLTNEELENHPDIIMNGNINLD
ncbi:hypothetical protein TH53_22870 [Pedobacter lusitanus]|uniref:Contig116, whole genome shotgun sequence n=1 Tax=Pedobacter lusitanus TaxID=1503925 RepID=A0A0D0GKV5_9SPHI|nr:hypothetical protein TH53_22870 [Pedobacter lusitanus]